VDAADPEVGAGFGSGTEGVDGTDEMGARLMVDLLYFQVHRRSGECGETRNGKMNRLSRNDLPDRPGAPLKSNS
jgi:hypothetical protein